MDIDKTGSHWAIYPGLACYAAAVFNAVSGHWFWALAWLVVGTIVIVRS